MSAIRLDDATSFRLRMLLDDGARVFECHAGFHEGDGLFETFAGGLNDANGVWVREGAGADVVGFVEVAVVAAVVEGDVEVHDVAIKEGSLVGDPVADHFVDGGADGFGKVHVVEGGGVGLMVLVTGADGKFKGDYGSHLFLCRLCGLPHLCNRL